MANKEKRLKLEEAEREAQASLSLCLAQKKREYGKLRVPKKKSSSELYDILGAYSFKEKEINSLESYAAKSYNLDRQKEFLIRHLYVKYPVPKFFFNLFTSQRPDHFGFNWFFCLAQGGSFQKLVKDLMTKKEVISFLEAPEDYTVEQAFWFAKMHHRGLPGGLIKKLIFDKDLFFGVNVLNVGHHERFNEAINFYGKYYKDMDERTFGEVTDFIKHKFADAAFSLKGRTLNSVKTLSNEWHVLVQKAQFGQKVSWAGIQNKIWVHEEEKQNIIWEIRELKSNHDLINEGRKLRHCIGGYVTSCLNGGCNIFSLRKYYFNTLNEIIKNRVTIEKRGKELVQVRGLMNRLPDKEEIRIIRKWAEIFGYNYEPPKNRWY